MPDEKRPIEISCKAAATAKIEELSEFQGEIKTLSPENARKLRRSILRYGFTAPIFIWMHEDKKDILDGHQRLTVLRALQADGYQVPPIPVAYIEAKTKAEAQRRLLLISSQYGKFQKGKLEEYVASLNESIEEIVKEVEIPELKLLSVPGPKMNINRAPLLPENPVSKRGDLYIMGEHRLICGDATVREDADRLMDGAKAAMIFTDPPYGIQLNTDFSSMEKLGKGKEYPAIEGDERPYDPAPIFEYYGYCKEIYLWGADYYAERIRDRNKGSWFVWDKGYDGPNDEYDKMFGSNFELCWSRTKHKRAVVRHLWKGIFGLSKEDTKARIHPTQKPVEMIGWFIEKFTKAGAIVVDPYGGSGSTLIACEKVGRVCRMLEIDPRYVDVIVKRWESYTGKKAEKAE